MFALRMADQRGLLHVDEMIDELSVAELIEWRAYYSLIGTDAWRQAGLIASEVHNAAELNAGRRTRTKPEDHIPLIRPEEKNGVDQKLRSLERALEGATGK